LQADLDGHGDHRIVIDHQNTRQEGILRSGNNRALQCARFVA